jgi:ADP-dependent NAD(P)H-hydrate dehydratase / NAD(P)H-hydrate epimerase
MRLVGSREMQEMDRFAIEEIGIPGAVLMENAARGATRVFLEHFDPPEGSRIGILCGRGNNGGDGYVMARYLQRARMRVTVAVLCDPSRVSGDGLLQLEIIRRLGLEILEAPGPEEWAESRNRLEDCDYLIDGILGTGLNAEITGYYRQVIEEVNRLGKPVTAIDIPSGIHAETGQVMGAAVKADLTVTFGFPKVGQFLFPGAGMVGRLARIDIGIPGASSDRIPVRVRLTEPEDFCDLLGPERKDVHKGTRGHLFILAGSEGKTGAAALTALGALRAGAGLVTVGVPARLNPILEDKLTEAMTLPLPDTAEGTLSLESEARIKLALQSKTALAIGPGLSTHPETVLLVRRLVASTTLPTVVDADGLNALAGEPEVLLHARGRIILTPHPGEMSRLAAIRTAEIQSDRIGTASAFVRQHGCCLVLKGAGTLIAEPGGEIWLNPTGNPALASGGTGDVLTGLIAGFLARGWPIARAAVAGVYLHGLAADLLSEEMGNSGILAGELPGVVPSLIQALRRGEWPLQGLAPHADLYHSL